MRPLLQRVLRHRWRLACHNECFQAHCLRIKQVLAARCQCVVANRANSDFEWECHPTKFGLAVDRSSAARAQTKLFCQPHWGPPRPRFVPPQCQLKNPARPFAKAVRDSETEALQIERCCRCWADWKAQGAKAIEPAMCCPATPSNAPSHQRP